MKVNPKAIALMAALSAGLAAAQSATPVRTDNVTNAGVSITNVATASYDIPNDSGGTTSASTTSNTVTTTVAPKMAFDLTYTTGADADGTDTATTAISSYQKGGVVPGATVVFPYIAVNNGNAKQTITLTSNATAGVSNIVFFKANPDTTPDGILTPAELAAAKDIAGNVITSVEVAPSGDDPATTNVTEKNTGTETFYMAYDVTGAPGAVVGATPIGTGQVWADASNGGTAPGANVPAVTEQKDPSAPAYDDLWWQYSSATIISPNLTNEPQTVTTTVTPPTGTPTIGYPSGGTPITVSGDEQVAYPKADADTANDTVTFTNTVKNGSTTPDTVTLTINANTTTFTSGGVTYTVTQTVTPTGTAGQYTVVQTVKDPAGTTVSTTTVTATISTPTLAVGASGSANYTVTVSYPDLDNGNPAPIYLKVGVDSGNDTDTVPNDFTFDTILPPGMKFGDATGLTDLTVATGAADTVNKPGTAGNPVSFPMEVVNTGEYADTYTLSGYTVVTKTDGTKQIVGITYSGGAISTTTTTRSVTDGGVTGTITVYTTTAVAANTEAAVSATVTLPADVASTAGTNYALKQTATSDYSGITVTDINDTITVSAAGSLVIGKFTAKSGVAAGSEFITGNPGTYSDTAPAAGVPSITNPAGYTALATSYAPNVNYSYQIIAKNSYNTGIQNFTLSDTLNTNLTYVSATCTVLNASGTATGMPACTASLSGSTVSTAALVLPAGATQTLTITVKVN